MAFNRASFEYIGGGANGAIWRYVTTDNLSTANVGDVMNNIQSAPVSGDTWNHHHGYWNDAFTYFHVRAFDMIFAVNHSSPTVTTWVVNAADANGVSVACASGYIRRQ